MKKIGILGGISHESTQRYYDLIHKKYFEQHRNYYYPEVVVYSLNFQKFTDLENQKDLTEYVEYIAEGIRFLSAAKVDFVVMAANSPHSVYDQVSKRSDVPILNIAEVAAREARRRNLKKLLLLGIKHTMQSTFYRDIFLQSALEVIVPTDEEQNLVDQLIFEELCRGKFESATKQQFLDIISHYVVDGVILGCTELPLILEQGDVNISVLNTLDLHVSEALRLALQ